MADLSGTGTATDSIAFPRAQNPALLGCKRLRSPGDNREESPLSIISSEGRTRKINGARIT